MAEEPDDGAPGGGRSRRRKREQRARTIDVARMPLRERKTRLLMHPDIDDLPRRPATREGCAGIERPCPFVSCRYNLYLDVNPRRGNVIINFPDLEPDQLQDSCALDVAERGPQTLERVGDLLNVTRERIRQIENAATERIEPVMKSWRGHVEDIARRDE